MRLSGGVFRNRAKQLEKWSFATKMRQAVRPVQCLRRLSRFAPMSSITPQVIAVGLSGGVDSAMVALKLKEAGHQVIGLTMAIWDGSVGVAAGDRPGCFGPGEHEDLKAAEEVARRLGIPHAVIPLAEEYKRNVLEYFRAEYRDGRTPNPCVRCNQSMKFGFMLGSARQLGMEFDHFATGHYARLAENPTAEQPLLLRSTDVRKDQSYFLSRLSREQLASVIFPLGGMTKEEVKQFAIDKGWADYAAKPESQDFLECGDYTALFSAEESVPGDFVDMAGKVLGQHKGIIHYTIGQRKGLNIGGQKDPLFVVAIEPALNQVVLGPREALASDRVTASQLNWLVDPASPLLDEPLIARIRLGHKGATARIVERSGEGELARLTVQFDEPQQSATPGQVLVLYHGEGVVASGIIEKAP